MPLLSNVITADVEFEGYCEKCGIDLNFYIRVEDNRHNSTYPNIHINPCSRCLEEARGEVRDELEKELEELRTTIDDLRKIVDDPPPTPPLPHLPSQEM